MKILGTTQYDANVSTTTNSLAAAMLVKPEILMTVSNLFEKNISAFSSILARKGLKKKNVFPDFSSPDFKVIGNRKMMWPLKGYPFRKGAIAGTVTSASGGTIGTPDEVFIIPLNTDYFSPNDILELKDRRTHIQLMDEYPVPQGAGVWNYKAKSRTNVDGYSIPADLLTEGSEVGFSYTGFPEMSETGYEKNTYFEWHTEYMGIQRMMYSISGSALNSVLWIEHKGHKLWIATQDMQMMERVIQARENQLIYGKATIDANDRYYVNDLKNRPIPGGNGLLAQGEQSLKFQYNKLTPKVLERVMQNLQLLANGTGEIEIVVLGGQAFIWDFERLMRDVFKFNPQPLFSNADGRGVDSSFDFYKMGGVKLICAWDHGHDAAWRPMNYDIYGVNKDSRNGIFVNLQGTIGGDPGIELVTLGSSGQDRSFAKKIIDGMVSVNQGGNAPASSRAYASNSMDGVQVHCLWETGICVKNPYSIAELYVP